VIFDSIEQFRASGFQPQVCITGSGPAGVTIARELASAGIPVVIFEAGGLEVSESSQEFYQGVTTGDPYFDLDVTRLRYFGGSSNHWAGWCRVMDAVDFEAKPHVPDSGWPITRADIEPYLDKTHDILELVPFKPDKPVSDDINWVQLIKSPAVRFGEKFRSEFQKSENIALVLNTYVTELSGDGKRVSSAKLWSNGADGGEFSAATFVICTGGLENSRLLLWSNVKSSGGLVPEPAALGRYWMEHPQFEGGDAILFDSSLFEHDETGEAFFSPSAKAIAERQILNFGIRLIERPYPGIKAMIADLACQAPDTAEWVAKGLGQHLRCAAQLYVGWEQSPVFDNHVALHETEKDAAGVPRIDLHWKKGALERRTLLEGLKLFGETLVKNNAGRVRIEEWVTGGQDYPTDQELAGHHHMGGTRMGSDPKKSVVDANCKVHGMENLFVGGSSVFTTSGQCNPTTTIVALALRLGAHLGKTLKV
jgi:choline dehydrogenase-like flavoprotein